MFTASQLFHLLFASIHREEVIVHQTTEKVVKLAKATYLGPKDNKDTYNRVVIIIYFKSKPYNLIEQYLV